MIDSSSPVLTARGAAAGLHDDRLSASLFDASDDCVKVVALDGRLLAMNANGICLMEIDDFEDLRGKAWSSLWPVDQAPAIEAAVQAARQGHSSRFTAECPTAKGVSKHWDVTVWPVLDDQGQPVRMVSISRDVSDRRRLEEEKSLHVRELAHRIKNMFAVVDGVIALSARNALQARPFADGLRERLVGLGRAFAYISPPERSESPQPGSLSGLLHVLLRPYGDVDGEQRRVWISGGDVAVGPVATSSLALVVHELATNAMKYGALRSLDGRVEVTVSRDTDGVGLVWEERGMEGSLAKPADAAAGFGTTLLDNSVIRQLGGRLTREWGRSGLVVTMRFDPERLAA